VRPGDTVEPVDEDRLRGHTSKSGALSVADVARRFPEAVIFDARFIRADQRTEPGWAP